MSIFTGIQCDECEKLCKMGYELFPRKPAKWLTIEWYEDTPEEEERTTETHHFCSLDCLRDWAIRNAEVQAKGLTV